MRADGDGSRARLGMAWVAAVHAPPRRPDAQTRSPSLHLTAPITPTPTPSP